MMDKVNVLGVCVDCIGLDEVFDLIRTTISAERRALITHVHVKGLNIAYETPWFRQFLNDSDLVYCDGMGVKLGARLLGNCIPYRFTLADWIWQLAGLAEGQGFSVFLLGNPPGVAERAAARLCESFPKLVLPGVHHGFFDRSPDSPENRALLEQINAAKADILLVGLGMPAQEKWLLENWDKLEVHIAITVGALFEYIAGDLARGPGWMVHNYLEWLFRLLRWPRRYAGRYLRDNPLFLYRLLKQKYFGRSAVAIDCGR